jgi:hypothetical protein
LIAHFLNLPDQTKPASLDPSASGTLFRAPSTSKGEGAIWASFPTTKTGVGKNKNKAVEQRFTVTEQPSKEKEVEVVLVWDEETQVRYRSPS